MTRRAFHTSRGAGRLAAALGCTVLGLTLGVVTPHAAAAPFVGPIDYATATNSDWIWVDDFDRDGKSDVLALGGETISFLRGAGDGGLVRPRAQEAGSNDGVLAGDLDGDGTPDLVILGSDDEDVDETGTFAVRLNRGDGTVAPGRSRRLPGPWSIVFLEDVDGDGATDILTVNGLPEDDYDEGSENGMEPTVEATVSVFLNRGDGTFGPGRRSDLAHEPEDAELADLNHDGRSDLVSVSRYDETVSVLLGSGGGGFRPARDYAADESASELELGDLNGDDRPELLVLNDSVYDDNSDDHRTLSVLANRGDGTFRPKRDYEVPENATGLSVEDLSGDGRADLVLGSGEKLVTVLLNKGDGSLGPGRDYRTADAAEDVRISDLNGDDRPELVVLAPGRDGVSVLVNGGNGSFGTRLDLETGRRPTDLDIGDLNGDGRPDLVVANAGQRAVSVLLNAMGSGGTVVAPLRAFPHARDYPTGPGTWSTAAGDLNGDGLLDLVATTRRNRSVAVLLGRPGGGYAAGRDYPVGGFPRWVAVGDLNGDGAPDLAVVNVLDETVSVLVNRGDGTFAAKRDYPAGRLPFVVAIADLDGDGDRDLVVGNGGGARLPVETGGSSVSVLLNEGDGTFAWREAYRTARAPLSVAIADIDGDGVPDLVTANSLRRSVSVLLGGGDGTFRARTDYRVGRFPRTVAVGDLDGDGLPDLAVANRRDASVSVLLNRGDGTFGEQRHFDTAAFPYSIAIGDFDGDGNADLATGDAEEWTAWVHPGHGDGTFGEPLEYPLPGAPRFLTAADLDGDGRLDLAVALPESVAVYLSRS